MLMNLFIATLTLATLVVLGLLWRLIQLRRRQDALRRIMDHADALERDLYACRERMQAMHRWVSTLPSTLTTQGLASLTLDPLGQKALRDLLQQRLWLRDHGESAPLAQLLRTRADLERSRKSLAENMEKLEAAGEALAAASTETHPVSALIAGAYGIGNSESRASSNGAEYTPPETVKVRTTSPDAISSATPRQPAPSVDGAHHEPERSTRHPKSG